MRQGSHMRSGNLDFRIYKPQQHIYVISNKIVAFTGSQDGRQQGPEGPVEQDPVEQGRALAK